MVCRCFPRIYRSWLATRQPRHKSQQLLGDTLLQFGISSAHLGDTLIVLIVLCITSHPDRSRHSLYAVINPEVQGGRRLESRPSMIKVKSGVAKITRQVASRGGFAAQ